MVHVPQRLVVADLLQHRDVRRGLADVLREQQHAAVVPVEARRAGEEPGGGHGVPGVVRDDAQTTAQRGLLGEAVQRGEEGELAQVVLVRPGGHEGVMEEIVVLLAVERDGHVVDEEAV